MGVRKKELFIGSLFAIIVAIFINYSAIERFLEDQVMQHPHLPNALTFSLVWFVCVSLLSYILYTFVLSKMYKKRSTLVTAVAILAAMAVSDYIFMQLYPIMHSWCVLPDIPQFQQHGNRPARRFNPDKGLNSTFFRHILVSVLNLLFVYIQRLLFRNQEVEQRNSQLQIEAMKSQHNALIQQINPHFFFNSLNSLRYEILQDKKDSAVEYLDNLTAIFRTTLKSGSVPLHSLSDELKITQSYIYIIEKRFEDKFSVEFDIPLHVKECFLPPLSILTLLENVVKHNKVSISDPIHVKIYTTPALEVVVENNIVPKFEVVESGGIGLDNLSKQSEIVTGRGADIFTDGKIFRVSLPLKS